MLGDGKSSDFFWVTIGISGISDCATLRGVVSEVKRYGLAECCWEGEIDEALDLDWKRMS